MTDTSFTTSFHTLLHTMCSNRDDADEELIRYAVQAVTALVASTKNLDSPVLLAPGFASHGLDHPLALAHSAQTLLDSNVVALNHLSTSQITDTLLLSYGAFLLHDIGMLLLPEGVPEELQSLTIEHLWSSDQLRLNHDQRSLQFIETTLSDTLPGGWSDYWSRRFPNDGGPLPVGKFELLLLARICQSHGDPESIWLNADSLETYTSHTTDRYYNFRTLFGPRIWGSLKGPVEAASTLLNLCDLLDIRSDRIAMPNADFLRSKTLPATPESRRQRLFHWAGNKLSRVKVGRNGISLGLSCRGGCCGALRW